MARSTNFVVKGTDGADYLKVPSGRTLANTTFDGGRGDDVLDLSTYGSPGVHVMLQGGYAKSASAIWEQPFIGAFSTHQPTVTKISGSIKNVESVIGTSGNDQLTLFTPASATKFADGGAGNDSVNPRGGLGIGGTGSDWLVSYLSGNVLVGGTYANGVATADGEADYYYIYAAPLILDFEVGRDQLIFERDAALIPAFEAAIWQSDGNGGSRLYVNNVLVVTLAGVAPADAETISLGFALGPTNGILQGSSGDDMLYSSSASERIMLGAGSGDDIVVDFTTNDVLVFQDGVQPVWQDVMLNGQQALVGTWAGGSVTLEGYTTASLGLLNIESVPGATAPGDLFFG